MPKPQPAPHNAVDQAAYARRQQTEFRQLCMAIAGDMLEELDKAGTAGVGVDVLVGICRSRGLSRERAAKVVVAMAGRQQIMRVGNHVYLAPKLLRIERVEPDLQRPPDCPHDVWQRWLREGSNPRRTKRNY